MKTTLQITLFAGICGILILIGPTACTRPDEATRILQNAGYTSIVITGYRPFMADEKETFSTGFEAISPSGQHVTGAVTGAVFKGSTIRFD